MSFQVDKILKLYSIEVNIIRKFIKLDFGNVIKNLNMVIYLFEDLGIFSVYFNKCKWRKIKRQLMRQEGKNYYRKFLKKRERIK